MAEAPSWRGSFGSARAANVANAITRRKRRGGAVTTAVCKLTLGSLFQF